MIHVLGTAGLYVGALAGWAFCIAYHRTARWRASEEGKHMMAFTAVIALALSYVSYRTLMGRPHAMPLGAEVARALIFCAIAALLLWRCWLLGRRQIWAPWRRSKKGS